MRRENAAPYVIHLRSLSAGRVFTSPVGFAPVVSLYVSYLTDLQPRFLKERSAPYCAPGGARRVRALGGSRRLLFEARFITISTGHLDAGA